MKLKAILFLVVGLFSSVCFGQDDIYLEFCLKNRDSGLMLTSCLWNDTPLRSATCIDELLSLIHI